MKHKSKLTSILVITAITMALSVGCSSKKAEQLLQNQRGLQLLVRLPQQNKLQQK